MTETSTHAWYLLISWKNVLRNRTRDWISQCVPASSRSTRVQTRPGECAKTAWPWMSETGLGSVYGGPWAPRGEPKLNKYLLRPVCIKGLHTWLWRQSDIKQGGVTQPAPAGMRTQFYDLPYLAMKIVLFLFQYCFHVWTVPQICSFFHFQHVSRCDSLIITCFFLFGCSGCKCLIQFSQTGVTGYHQTVYTGANSTFNFPAVLFLFFPFHEADSLHFCGFACTFPSADLQQVWQTACQRVNLWTDHGTEGTACF